MYLGYKPGDADEWRLWELSTKKLMSAERETLERLTGSDFIDAFKGVVGGNSKARRAMLYVLLKREHPTIKFDDVDFAWDEVDVLRTPEEYDEIKSKLTESGALSGAELDMALQSLDQEAEEKAVEVDEQGKARLRNAA